MSRIGIVPISVPDGVKVSVTGNDVKVEGPKGSLEVNILPMIKVKNEPSNQLVVTRQNETTQARQQHGLMRTLLANAIQGVTEGYTKTLEINGVGFKVQVNNNNVVLNLGYSHPNEVALPEGVAAKVDGNTLSISGIDKQLVGQVAATIRSLRPPEPYKGKGIIYSGEQILRKAGKAAGAQK